MTDFDSLTDDLDETQEASGDTTEMSNLDLEATPLFCSPVLDRIRTSD